MTDDIDVFKECSRRLYDTTMNRKLSEAAKNTRTEEIVCLKKKNSCNSNRKS